MYMIWACKSIEFLKSTHWRDSSKIVPKEIPPIGLVV